MYYNARYYDPQIGRFITPDNIIPDMTNSQSFNRYMYVEGNPINYRDMSGHFSVKGTFKKIVNTVRDGAKKVAGYVADHKQQIKQGLYTGIGFAVGGQIGGLYGYAIGSKNGLKGYWNDNKWFRIYTYAIATTAVIAACFCLPMIAPAYFGVEVGGALTGGTIIGEYGILGMQIGAIAGAAYGGILGGTNGFTGGWDWEKAANYMMKGAIIGAVTGYVIGNYFDFANYIHANPILEGIKYGGIPGMIANQAAALTGSSMVLQLGVISVALLSLKDIITYPQNTERLFNHHEFNFIPGLKIKF